DEPPLPDLVAVEPAGAPTPGPPAGRLRGVTGPIGVPPMVRIGPRGGCGRLPSPRGGWSPPRVGLAPPLLPLPTYIAVDQRPWVRDARRPIDRCVRDALRWTVRCVVRCS